MTKMNRHERRAAKKRNRNVSVGDRLDISCGRLLEGDPNYGLPVNCYVCGASHKALGLMRIAESQEVTHVPLCELCVHVPDADDKVVRKYWGAADLVIEDMGDITTEQLLATAAAMAEKPDATEH